MTDQEKTENLLINENAYFYQKNNAKAISPRVLAQLFTRVSSEKVGHYLLNQSKVTYTGKGKKLVYSICVFRYHTVPTFIDKFVAGWEETKIAYLLIVEYQDYIIISRKNISKIQDFVKDFRPLPYEVLSTLFVTDDTSFEKFSLKNLNVSDKTIREKSIEAIDLKETFSALGASNYMLSSLRVKNDEDKISMLLNSSRINKFGKKNNIEAFCDWSAQMVDKIKGHVIAETFLSIFAEPQDYEALKDTLVPISILFNFGDIYTDFENGRIARMFIRLDTADGPHEKEINLFGSLSKIERLTGINTVNNKHLILNPIAKDLELKLNDSSITLRSQKLRQIIIQKDNGLESTFLEYLNGHNAFIVNFENIDMSYSNRKLFRDNRLLGNISHFLKIFSPDPALDTTTSEKGDFTPASTAFTAGSVFDFVEANFAGSHDFLICDDLGREWADHIGINPDRIVFYHSKHKNAQSSATAFQDIVGQAQKNLGNLSPQAYRIDDKRGLWESDYVTSTGVHTAIARLRKGASVDDAISQFKETLNNPNLKKEVVLALDFISKAQLTIWLENLRDGIPFGERNEAIQILWFISSLINSCYEVNAGVTIWCKP